MMLAERFQVSAAPRRRTTWSMPLRLSPTGILRRIQIDSDTDLPLSASQTTVWSIRLDDRTIYEAPLPDGTPLARFSLMDFGPPVENLLVYPATSVLRIEVKNAGPVTEYLACTVLVEETAT